MDTHEVVIDRIRNLMNERGWTENKLEPALIAA